MNRSVLTSGLAVLLALAVCSLAAPIPSQRPGQPKQRFILKGHGPGTIWSIVFSPDGKTVATASADRTVKLWDVASGKCVRTFKGHTVDYKRARLGAVFAVAFSPDG